MAQVGRQDVVVDLPIVFEAQKGVEDCVISSGLDLVWCIWTEKVTDLFAGGYRRFLKIDPPHLLTPFVFRRGLDLTWINSK